ncbi:hypothetical protein CDAR_195131 [Caerostris darwini]|uniref:Uncharacterized protein n=1 Tax=Caerostris darwini TaxID=1538125 RepID=A0AAV4X5E9_9ARAC|nr:hypothetical protein CDAR_195131 [Caerostris darwini]
MGAAKNFFILTPKGETKKFLFNQADSSSSPLAIQLVQETQWLLIRGVAQWDPAYKPLYKEDISLDLTHERGAITLGGECQKGPSDLRDGSAYHQFHSPSVCFPYLPPTPFKHTQLPSAFPPASSAVSAELLSNPLSPYPQVRGLLEQFLSSLPPLADVPIRDPG